MAAAMRHHVARFPRACRESETPRENDADGGWRGSFAPKSSRIARVLLGSPATLWQVQALAKEAQISIGLASRIKDALLYQKFLEPVNGRFRVCAARTA